MSRFDAILFENHFAIGSTRYEDHYPGDEINPRIVVSVAPERDNGIEHSIQMIVDTGATWCVLDPEVAESWGLLTQAKMLFTLDLTANPPTLAWSLAGNEKGAFTTWLDTDHLVRWNRSASTGVAWGG